MKFDRASDFWQQLELASTLESELRNTVDLGRIWLVDFNVGKTQLVSFERPKNSGAIDVQMDGSILEEKFILDVETFFVFSIGFWLLQRFYC